MGRQTRRVGLLTFGLLLLLQSTESDVVSLKMRAGSEASPYIYINFYNDNFTVFYDCLSSNIWQECSAIFASDTSTTHQNNTQYVTYVAASKPISVGGSGYFKCTNDQQTRHLLCTRQPEETALCGAPKLTQASTFVLKDGASDSHTCVGIIWAWPDESVTFSNHGTFGACELACSSHGHTEARTFDSEIATIIGITVTVAVLVAVVVIALVCWRRSRIPIQKRMEEICATSPVSCVGRGSVIALQTSSSDLSF
ncbi:hypothetical protein BsWGS_09340 [Bradybaena similaris]